MMRPLQEEHHDDDPPRFAPDFRDIDPFGQAFAREGSGAARVSRVAFRGVLGRGD